MLNKKTEFGAIIGVNTNGVISEYNIIAAKSNGGAAGDINNWMFKRTTVDSHSLAAMLSKRAFINAELKNSNIAGRYASLDRFNKNPNILVILTIIKKEDTNEIVGYKIATSNGAVKNIKLAEMLAYCSRATKSGLVPIQNAMFVPETNESGIKKAAFIRMYAEDQVHIEFMSNDRNKYVKTAEVKIDENKSKLDRMGEIFTPEQLKELQRAKSLGTDVRVIGNNKLSTVQMHILTDMMKSGFNARLFASPSFKEDCLRMYLDEMQQGNNVKNYINPDYTLQQLFVLSLASQDGLPMNKLANPKVSEVEMQEIYERLEKGIWKKDFEVQTEKIEADK